MHNTHYLGMPPTYRIRYYGCAAETNMALYLLLGKGNTTYLKEESDHGLKTEYFSRNYKVLQISMAKSF